MASQYCSSCGAQVMPTMRLCPSCGNRSFSPTPVVKAPTSVPSANPTRAPVAPHVGNQVPHASIPSISASASVPQFTRVGHWRRLSAYLIDYTILTVITVVLGAMVKAIGVFDTSAKGAFVGGVVLLFAAVVPFVYFTVLHSSDTGASWGKAAMGIRVVTLGGERLTGIQAFVRCFLTLLIPMVGFLLVAVTAAGTMGSDIEGLEGIGAAALIIGVIAASVGPYLTVYFNPQHQTLFDLICKTCVINKT